MPLCLNQVKGKHWRRRTGLDNTVPVYSSSPVLQSSSIFLGQRNPTKPATPPPGLSYPAPRHTPRCHRAAGGPDVSAPAPLPHCLCCLRCRGGQTGDMGQTGWGKERWQVAGWGGGPHLSSGSPPRRRRGWPDTDPGSWYFLHC